ncbi:MAG: hypothetical protein QHJ73_01800 [Armatimonadota bacterium]|nr:hypothetical protein [Armatimonadota bacterium]
MATATAVITPGVCGQGTKVTATHDDGTGVVTLTLHTECQACRRLAETLHTVDGMQAAFTPPPQNPVYLAAAQARLHAACVVPAGIIKAVEIACGLALPADVSIRLTKE